MPQYPNQTPNLGNLNFDDIKDSIKNYLKQQTTLKDFNFEGSVLQTMLNALAYNTYYYAFYANMVANEMFLDSAQKLDSVISLTKPLGYFVPLKTTSVATINLYGINTDVPEYTQFYGFDVDGLVYSFYTIAPYIAQDSDALNVKIYEGKILHVNFDVTNTFDNTKQRFFINDPDIDANTLKVKIQLNGQETPSAPKDVWVLADALGQSNTADQNIYYLERTNNGVFVLFGKNNSLGNSVDSTVDKIYIDYIATNGSAANGIVEFSLAIPGSLGPSLNIGLQEKSVGGTDEPDLDFIKFVAPRSFASQNRAVTKDDIKGLIAPFFASANDFNVFGGDEIFPRMYGRVFFTADLNPNVSADSEKIQRITSLLRSKCVITITPEFTTPRQLTVTNDVNFRIASNQSTTQEERQKIRAEIKTIINNEFDSIGEYNFIFNSQDVINRILTSYPNVIIEPSDFTISYSETLTSDGSILLNLENELDLPYLIYYDITGEYLDANGNTIKQAVYLTPGQNLFEFVNLRTFKKDGDTFVISTDVNGRINVKRGVIEIYDNRQLGSPIPINVQFKNSYFSSILNNKVVFRTTSVELK